MRARKERKCPVEDYGVEIAGEVLPGIYADQRECAETHGCVRDVCLLEGAWPEEISANEDLEQVLSGNNRIDWAEGEVEVRASWECLGSD